nr:pyridoxamine 5'-phosphate oxidase family protein [Desemzia sp. C1]
MSNNDSTQNEKARSVLKDILEDTDVVMLTTISEDGNIVSRPMQTQEVEFDEDLWLVTRKDTTKYKEISANPNVNVTVVGDSYASISGKAVFVDDIERKKEFWNKIYEKCSMSVMMTQC